jgi:hypothetical protein
MRPPFQPRRRDFRAFALCLSVLVSTGAADDNQPLAAPSTTSEAAETAQAETAQPAIFGIVIRLSESIFRSPNRFVSRTTPVNQTIAGLRNSGTAHVNGELLPDFRTKRDGVRMDLVFRGTSVSQTVGRQRGARIHTRTTTGVEVATPLTFELQTGFVAGIPRSRAAVAAMSHQVEVEACGLRALIIRRVARNRIARQQHQIRYESAEHTRRRIASEVGDELTTEVERLNTQLDPWRQFLLAQPWYASDRKIDYSSDEQHLILTIRGDSPPRAAEPSADELIVFPPSELPPAVPGGLVDVIFYEDPADKSKVALLLKVIETFINESTADLPIAERLSFETTDGPNWVKLSISQDSAPARPPAPTSHATPSGNLTKTCPTPIRTARPSLE